MKVFISHASNNYDLAKTLKQILEDSTLIKESFIFEDKKKFGKAIDKKITDEIIQSDYLIAIITNDALSSASVNQELGYAQALDIERIPIVQKDSEIGFLIYGDEIPRFTLDNFESTCIEVRKYILDSGSKPKYSKEEKELIQKSAHYRQHIETAMIRFLDETFLRLSVGTDADRWSFINGTAKDLEKGFDNFKHFFKRNESEIIIHLSSISFITFHKLSLGYRALLNTFKTAEKFPNDDFPQHEIDLLINLKEEIEYIDPEDIDMEKYFKNMVTPNTVFDFKDGSSLIQMEKYKHEVYLNFRFFIQDLQRVVFSMIRILELYLEYKEKFDKLAFKTP